MWANIFIGKPPLCGVVSDRQPDWIVVDDDPPVGGVVPALSLTPDGTVQFVNDAWLTLTGHDRATVLGEQLRAFVPDEQAGRLETALQEISADQSVACDLRIEHADRLPIHVRLSGQAERDTDGDVRRIHCQMTSRTEPRDSRGTIVEQNALLRTLLDGLPIGILAETADRTVLAVNDELLSLFDIPRDRRDMIGADCARLAAEASDEFADPPAFVAGIEARIDEGEPVIGERLERTDERVFERSYLPIELPTGSGHLWLYDDVTEEQARKADLKTYERLVDVAPVGVFRTTTDGRVLTTNQRMADILGYDGVPELLESHQALERDLYVDSRRRQTFLERLQTAGIVEDFEYEARTKDGGRRWLSMNARLLDERDDGARVITGFTWDVTDRKRHERQLMVLGRILRHNLRNALTVIEGQADLLATGSADSPEDAMEMISSHADTLLELADKERAIVRLLRGPRELGTRDLSAMAATVRDDLRAEHPEATIDLTAPESARATVCLGFEAAIRELLENAIVHSGDDDPCVSLTVRSEGDVVDIEVADTGPGLPDIERGVLRGEVDETPLYHSAGIGLFLVRQLTQASNGRIRIHDNEPRGSVVQIRVPVAGEVEE